MSPKDYLKFVAKRQLVDSSLGVCPLALLLLEVVAIKESEGQRMTVTDAMHLYDLASPATMHRKINDLVELGYVSLQYRSGNRRTKYLSLTEHSMNHFTALATMIG